MVNSDPFFPSYVRTYISFPPPMEKNVLMSADLPSQPYPSNNPFASVMPSRTKAAPLHPFPLFSLFPSLFEMGKVLSEKKRKMKISFPIPHIPPPPSPTAAREKREREGLSSDFCDWERFLLPPLPRRMRQSESLYLSRGKFHKKINYIFFTFLHF